MQKNSKIIIGIFIAVLLALLAFGGYYLYKHKNYIKNYLPKGLPSLSQIGKSNLPGTLFGPKSSDKASKLDPNQVLYWTNKYRQENNLKALTTNNLLTQAAQKKVDDMFANQYFEHNSPTGQTPGDLVLTVGYKYKVSGENLALGDFKNEKDLVDAWMASPGHRANILNTDYTEIGIATGLNKFEDRGTTWLAVQEFGKPAPNCQSPDKNLLNQINGDRTEYESLVSNANNLYNQANSEIQQGNDIYYSTHDTSQAQPYWDAGTAHRDQADQIKAQAENLYSQITNESSQYNLQVDSYNNCINQ